MIVFDIPDGASTRISAGKCHNPKFEFRPSTLHEESYFILTCEEAKEAGEVNVDLEYTSDFEKIRFK